MIGKRRTNSGGCMLQVNRSILQVKSKYCKQPNDQKEAARQSGSLFRYDYTV